MLTHWGRVTHICVSKLTIIGSDNGLSPERRQANIWTNGILLIGTLGTNFSEILIGIQTFSFKKMHLKMSSANWRPFVLASMYLPVDVLLVIRRCSNSIILRPGQNGWHYDDDIFNCIFLIENHSVLIKIPSMFVIRFPNWQLISISSGNGLVPSGSKPLPEPMLTSIRTLDVYGVTRPQWVK